MLTAANKANTTMTSSIGSLWPVRGIPGTPLVGAVGLATTAVGATGAAGVGAGAEAAVVRLSTACGGIAALDRLLHLEPLENVGLGLAVSMLATAINGGVGLVLIRASKRHKSITLRADGFHLLTDVWTSLGVLVGVLLVQVIGQLILAPIVALLVAANIAWTAIRLLRDSALGLMDTALPPEDRKIIREILQPYEERGVRFHAFRSRMSGQRRFLSMHVLLHGSGASGMGMTCASRSKGRLSVHFQL